jgi:hypothetical protein
LLNDRAKAISIIYSVTGIAAHSRHWLTWRRVIVFTLINADAEDDDAEITDPQEIAELFAAIAAVAIEAIGVGQARQLFDAVIEQDGKDPN